MNTSNLNSSCVFDLGPRLTSAGVIYTIWAPERTRAEIVVHASAGKRIVPLQSQDGYFVGTDPKGAAGDLYTLTLDQKFDLPDLASRFQPQGLSGPSMVVESSAYAWKTPGWKRPAWGGQIIYEVHVGTFTEAGTYRAAVQKLDHLVALGVNAIQLMPLAECTGNRNWGYDGVLLFAPYHPYGTPDELRFFVDRCHEHGIAVILDIVYNHIGAIGDITDYYSKYLSHAENNGAWGKHFNLDGENSNPVRQLLLQNIRYWLDEFHIDGFRLDATHAIRDESPKHLVAEMSELIHARGGFVIAEDDRNCADLIESPSEGAWKLDAAWADDFHHTFRVSQTRESQSYYGRYDGTLAEIAETIHHGWLFRGQNHPKLDSPRGTPCSHLSPKSLVYCISNHDQVGNRPFGERLHHVVSPEAYRAMSLFFCFVPYTPMLFMGQEWGASSPFLFFTDHPGDFGRLVTEGRNREFAFDAKQHGGALPDCQDPSTFINSKLKWDECDEAPHQQILTLYREALELRNDFFQGGNPKRSDWDIQALPDSLLLDYRWSRSSLKIMFRPAGNYVAPIGKNKILIRSNEERFGGGGDSDAPETLVTSVDF